jgi:hypothetical protein
MAVESNGTILFEDRDGLYQLDPTAATPVATQLVPGGYFTLAIAPTVNQWTGQGSDNLWSDGANWLSGSAPTAGADLVFPSGAQRLNTVDDLGFAFHSITVADHYSIAGQALTVTGNLLVRPSASLEVDNTLTVAAGGNLVVQGSVTVPGNGTLDDQGTVTVAAGGSLADNSLVTVENGAILDVQGALTVAAGGALDDQGSTTVEAGASVDVLGTLTVEVSATLDVSGTVFLEASSTYAADPLATVIVEQGGYLGPPM